MRPCIRLWLRGLAASAWLISIGTAHGQHQDSVEPALDSAEPALTLDSVVVSASRSETTAADAPSRVEVVTEEDLAASGARTVAEALENHPGVQITESYRGHSIQLQGLSGQYVLVLVDGERAIGRTGGDIDLDRIDASQVDRIEIVKGAASALYGSDALGGVIHVITRKSRAPFSSSAAIEYGYTPPTDLSNGEVRARAADFATEQGHALRAHANAGVVRGPWRVRANASYRYAGSYDATPEDLATSSGAFDELQGGAQAGYEWHSDAKTELSLSARHEALFAIDENAQGAVFDRSQRELELNASSTTSFSLGEAHQARVSLGYHLVRSDYASDQRQSDALDTKERAREQLAQLSLQDTWSMGDSHLLLIGAELMAEELVSPRIESKGRRVRVSPFAQHEWTASEFPYVSVVPAIRADYDSDFGTHLSPKLTLRYDPSPDLVLRATGARGFRAPSFKEQHLRFENQSVGYVVAGNPNLQPERSWYGSVSAHFQPWAQLTVDVEAHRNQLDNLIHAAPQESPELGRTVYAYENVAEAYTQGVELSVTAGPVAHTQLRASYTWLDTEDGSTGRPLEGRAAHSASFQLDHALPAIGLRTQAQASVLGPRTYGNDASHAPTYALVKTRIAYAISRDIDVHFTVRNLLNASDAHVFIRPRTFLLGLSASYDDASNTP